mmetsp:Transcript_1945/g.5961  ORF Transcript_1945/g.5961 Transcript_1945/m.5961 type:complete len:133 (-) Transcript_1945:270-668(-)
MRSTIAPLLCKARDIACIFITALYTVAVSVISAFINPVAGKHLSPHLRTASHTEITVCLGIRIEGFVGSHKVWHLAYLLLNIFSVTVTQGHVTLLLDSFLDEPHSTCCVKASPLQFVSKLSHQGRRSDLAGW